MTAPLPHAFYARSTLAVAPDLLGKVLVHRSADGVSAGIIVEAEAYIGMDDPACHASAGRTRRNEPLFGPPGFAYVYLNYGIHFLFNVVTEADGHPAAVLVRALEPTEGLPLMRARRAGDRRSGAVPDHELCKGPGALSRAMGIGLEHNRHDLRGPRLYLEDRGVRPEQVAWSPRIGISAGTDRPWRCYLPGHPSVSGTRSRGVALHLFPRSTQKRRGRAG